VVQQAGLDQPQQKRNQVEIDHLELQSTTVTPRAARFFSWAFVLVLFVVPVSQAAMELRRAQLPQALELFNPFVRSFKYAADGRWHDALSASRNGIRPETLHSYESSLENSSALRSFFQPRAQEILTRFLGAGSEKVVLGSSGWLFYQPGLAYVTRPNLVAPVVLELASKKMVDKDFESSPNPDPRPALLQLHRDCLKAGIHLVVFPAPDKVMLQPMQLDRRIAPSGTILVPNNTGYRQFVNEMKANGVDWFDAAPAAVHAVDVRYLVQDTHWTPEFMEAAAERLAVHVQQTGVLPEGPRISLHAEETQVSRVGDLVDMLKLPAGQSIFKPQTVTIQKIIDDFTGRPVEPDQNADVLLVGDSFTNIYSQPEMGWGTGAGFAEHLAFRLRRKIDVIAFNGGGAARVRASLAGLENAERLGSKKMIIYEFAIRDLLGENWKPFPLVTTRRPLAVPSQPQAQTTLREPSQSRRLAAPPLVAPLAGAEKPAEKSAERVPGVPADALVVTGRIIQTSKVPTPGTAPYKDCLTFIKFSVESVESGSYEGTEVVVVFLAMKNDEWLPPAKYSIGDRFRLTLIRFSKTERQIRSLQRADDLNDYTLLPFYALRETQL
jgi:hypothetical protein